MARKARVLTMNQTTYRDFTPAENPRPPVATRVYIAEFHQESGFGAPDRTDVLVVSIDQPYYSAWLRNVTFPTTHMNAAYLWDVDGSLTALCGKCERQPAQEPSPCPYALEISGGGDPCDCCDICATQCADDIQMDQAGIADVIQRDCPCARPWLMGYPQRPDCSCENTGCWKISQTGGIPCKGCECHATHATRPVVTSA